LKEVNPAGTSQTCICGETVKKDLSVRHHRCLVCGHSEHRDIVSAKVILKIGLGHNLKDKTYAVGQSVSLESPIHTL
jgi:transposase